MDIQAGSPVLVPGTLQWDRLSEETGRSYRIYVSPPPGPAPADGYPLLLVIDAEQFVFGAVQEARMRGALGDIGAPLIVAIGYGDCDPAWAHQRRIEDFGVIAPDGASQFCRFLVSELLPWVAAQWPVDPARRGIFGFSLGALAALEVLRQRPEAFNRYVAASPSLWWGDAAMIRAFAEEPPPATVSKVPVRLLVSWGEHEEDPTRAIGVAGMTPEGAAQMVEMTRMITNAKTFVRHLRQADRLAVTTWSFPGETHASVAWAALSRALSFILRD